MGGEETCPQHEVWSYECGNKQWLNKKEAYSNESGNGTYKEKVKRAKLIMVAHIHYPADKSR